MAQWNRNNQDFLNSGRTLYEVQMQADQYGNIINPGALSKSAFGEPISVPVTPVLQLDGLYGLDPRQFETYTGADVGLSGTASTTGTLMQVTTGNDAFGYGVLRSKRAVRYRPGQGAQARFTAMFTATDGVGVAGYTQRAGFFTQEQALQIGFDGEQFGVLRQNGGKAHIHVFTVDTAATGTGNISIELDGTTTVVAVTSGDSTSIVARKIADAFASSGAWLVEYSDTKVCFLAQRVGPKAGAFSFTDTGTTGVTSTLSNTQAGVAHTETWTYQTNFNIDTLDGNGPSGVTLDPSKLNVFQINFRWLGAGELRYAIENPINGDMIFFHHEHYSNQNTDVHLDNPSLKIGYVAYSTGGTGTDVTVSGASIMGAIEGLIQTTKLPTAASISSNPNPNLAALSYHHALTIHNRLVYSGKINTREVLLKNINASFTTSPTGKPITVYMYYNFDALPDLEYQTQSDQYSSVYYSTTSNVVVPGNTNLPIYIFDVPGNQSVTIDLDDLRIALPPNSNLSIVIRSGSGTAIDTYAASLSWVED